MTMSCAGESTRHRCEVRANGSAIVAELVARDALRFLKNLAAVFEIAAAADLSIQRLEVRHRPLVHEKPHFRFRRFY